VLTNTFVVTAVLRRMKQSQPRWTVLVDTGAYWWRSGNGSNDRKELPQPSDSTSVCRWP